MQHVRAERVGRREFDPHQVDEFRDSLIEALRNASNIRNLRENDWITLIVRGRTNEESERRVDVLIPGNHPEMVTRLSDDRDGENTMVLRVKKSDVDQLASKKTSPDQFKEKVSINIY